MAAAEAAAALPPALHKEFDEKLRPLLQRYNRIREHLRDEPDVHAAQIVVIGDQSAGKSSVLEALIHVSLPRGQGVVTKVPIVLESHSIPDSESPYATVRRGVEELPQKSGHFDAQEDAVISMTNDLWAQLGPAPSENGSKRRRLDASPAKKPEEKRIEIGEIDARIREEQTAILRGRSFSDVPIYVDVYQSGVPDITLVDLPGINYETADNKKRIRQIYLKYITPEESLILNIMPATSDIAANESCLFAKDVDPRRIRTINVFTKIDKADPDIVDKIRGQGRFVVVRNRTQEENDRGVPLAEVRRLEEEAIRRIPALGGVSPDSLGTDALAKMLIREDYTRMRSSIARLLRKVPAKQNDIRKMIDSMPRPCSSEADKRKLFDDWIQAINTRIADLMRGKWLPEDPEDMHMNARMQDLFDEHDKVMRAVTAKFFRPEFRQLTYKAVRESRGVTLANFIQDPVLKMLISREIQGVRHLGDKLVDDCTEYLVDKLATVALQTFDRFTQAGKEVVSLLTAELERVGADTKQVIMRLFDAELNGPYTVNHYYMDTLNKIRDQIREQDSKEPAAAAGPWGQQQFSGGGGGGGTAGEALADANVSLSDLRQMVGVSNDDQATFDMQCALFSYWKVVQKRLTDYAHMLIRSTLCSAACTVGQDLWNDNQPALSPLMDEPHEVAAERRELEYRHSQLCRVEEELRQISLM
eukprot:TRINITY_DN708_c0_g1_i1.p1 TRINITY_DN708_c0_g1~~TRINITY_DN708_c0_g1_i1.p1  ORF type:complete len:725 (+),score=279.84 TRINITY_DN708_c0_g1_i1:72-2177(+)